MEEQRRRISSVPDLAEVEKERNRLKRRKEYGNALRGTCFSLLAVAAIAVLAATLFLPVLQVTGTSMEPTLYDGESGIYPCRKICRLSGIAGKPRYRRMENSSSDTGCLC